jgi:hypothetical protein
MYRVVVSEPSVCERDHPSLPGPFRPQLDHAEIQKPLDQLLECSVDWRTDL